MKTKFEQNFWHTQKEYVQQNVFRIYNNIIIGAPYRGAGWTPQGYAPAQQAYRYTAPIHQPSYAAYTPHTTAVS